MNLTPPHDRIRVFSRPFALLPSFFPLFLFCNRAQSEIMEETPTIELVREYTAGVTVA
jgi:hypothetical protein